MDLHKNLNLHFFDCHRVSIYLTSAWIAPCANCLWPLMKILSKMILMKCWSLKNHPRCTDTNVHKLIVPYLRKSNGTESICLPNATGEQGDTPLHGLPPFCLPDCLAGCGQLEWVCAPEVQWSKEDRGAAGHKSHCVSNARDCSGTVLSTFTLTQGTFTTYDDGLQSVTSLGPLLPRRPLLLAALPSICSSLATLAFLLSLTHPIYSQLQTFLLAALSACTVPLGCTYTSIRSVLKNHLLSPALPDHPT